MFGENENQSEMTAADARRHLTELEAERFLAIDIGFGDVETYMADLNLEIEAWCQVYVVFAVTEIATLRGELGERNEG